MDEQTAKFLKSFISESTDLLDQAEESVLTLEKGFEQDRVDQLFRAIHTIKGNSGLFDLGRIKELAHIFESVLSKVRSREILPDVETIDLFLLSIDRLRRMIEQVEQSERMEVADLVQRLEAMQNPEAGPSNQSDATADAKSLADFRAFCEEIRTKLPPEAMKGQGYLACAVIDLAAQPEKDFGAVAQRVEALRNGLSVAIHGISPALLPEFPGASRWTLPYFIVFESERTPSQVLTSGGLLASVIDIIHPPVKATAEAPEPQEIPAPVVAAQTEVVAAAAAQPPVPPPAPGPSVVKGPTDVVPQRSAEGESKGPDVETHLKVPLPLIENLINLASEAVIARNELMQKIEQLGDPSIAVSAKKISYMVSRIQEGIMRTRLQELETLFQRLPRLVRDVCSQTGKHVQFSAEGGNVELDKTLIDSIRDPLTHIIRNSIDHGIESPQERSLSGKPSEGRVRLEAFFRGGNVVIMVSDDGRGLNYERIREKAVQKGILTAEQARDAAQPELAELIFLPGFSTSETVTTTSGRGVGMDVVRTSLKKAGGTAEITSESGKGTSVILTIPQTLSIITCILVKSGGTRYAVPQVNVRELLQLEKGRLDQVQDSLAYEIRGHLLPLIHLNDLLDQFRTGERTTTDIEAIDSGFIIVVETEQHRFGLLLDEILNPEEIVVKSLGSEFAGVKIFSGAAIMGDGGAVLILDVPGIARHRNVEANIALEGETAAVDSSRLTGADESGYLIFESSAYFFGVPVSSIPRIVEIETHRIESLLDFEILNYQSHIVPLLRLEKIFNLESKVDMFDRKTMFVVLFNIDGFRVGVLASQVHNVVTSFEALDRTTFVSESVTGYAVVNGRTTMLLDIEDLAARFRDGRYRALKQHLSENLEGVNA